MTTHPSWAYPFWIAHRGAGKAAPENTLAAFREGAANGYRMFECDAKLSADGELFLLHDTDLDRTTNATGRAGNLTWDRLSRLDAGSWHSPRYAGEPLARLAALLQFALAADLLLDIEIKPTPGQEAATGHRVAELVARIWPAERRPAPLLTSFAPAALAAAQQAAPELPRGLLLSAWRDGWQDELARLRCSALVADHALLDADTVRYLHGTGIAAAAYTVDDEAEAQRLEEAGVDALVTDRQDWACRRF